MFVHEPRNSEYTRTHSIWKKAGSTAAWLEGEKGKVPVIISRQGGIQVGMGGCCVGRHGELGRRGSGCHGGSHEGGTA